ncbi:AI-2E family transporter [Sphingobacterium sp. SGG-5]|uniref:AI-2E family transporter n=1 Tax=Sphingobacterium sp. SGG-5 TaxID=2710881 RepID=UPI0019D18803|nr:AI-2E family transporter [Sphingobacterium sp. SGG-5]
MLNSIRNLQNIILVLLLFSLSVVILYFAKGFLVPLALASVLAMLLTKICRKFESLQLHRSLAALFSVFLLVISFSLIATLIGWQLSGFTENLSELKQQGLKLIDKFRDWLNENMGIDRKQQEEITASQENSSNGAGEMLMGFATGTLSIAVDTILVMVYTFLLLLYRTRIKKFVLMLVKSEFRGKATAILHKSSAVAQQYLEGLSKMIVLLWIMYGIGFSALGVENALFFAVLCGILEIVPFVGNLLGTTFTVLAVAAQGGDNQIILGVIAVYMLVQFIQTYILEPLVVGSQVRINPLFTIIGLVAGELLWGVAGMVLAIPLLGIMRIVFDNIPHLKPYAYLIGSDQRKGPSLFEKIKRLFNK